MMPVTNPAKCIDVTVQRIERDTHMHFAFSCFSCLTHFATRTNHRADKNDNTPWRPSATHCQWRRDGTHTTGTPAITNGERRWTVSLGRSKGERGTKDRRVSRGHAGARGAHRRFILEMLDSLRHYRDHSGPSCGPIAPMETELTVSRHSLFLDRLVPFHPFFFLSRLCWDENINERNRECN